MKFYIAARFSRRPEANRLAHFLKSHGHEVTSRWVLPDCDHVIPTGLSEQAQDDERRRFAREDIEDMKACDCCISLMEESRSNGRGGRHVEFGFTLALGKKQIIIGPKETVFHNLDEVEVYQSMKHFMVLFPLTDWFRAMEVRPKSRGWYYVTLCQFKKIKEEHPSYIKENLFFDGNSWEYAGEYLGTCYVCFIHYGYYGRVLD